MPRKRKPTPACAAKRVFCAFTHHHWGENLEGCYTSERAADARVNALHKKYKDDEGRWHEVRSTELNPKAKRRA